MITYENISPLKQVKQKNPWPLEKPAWCYSRECIKAWLFDIWMKKYSIVRSIFTMRNTLISMKYHSLYCEWTLICSGDSFLVLMLPCTLSWIMNCILNELSSFLPVLRWLEWSCHKTGMGRKSWWSFQLSWWCSQWCSWTRAVSVIFSQRWLWGTVLHHKTFCLW